MRAYLQDRRAYELMKLWLQGSHQKTEGYNLVENFRRWVALTTNHFFDVTGPWPDEYVEICRRTLNEQGKAGGALV